MVLLLILAACGGAEEQRQGPTGGFRGGPGGGQPVIPAVEVVQAQRGALPLEERLTGRVSARNQTFMSITVILSMKEIRWYRFATRNTLNVMSKQLPD
jgi:hypothetical protein